MTPVRPAMFGYQELPGRRVCLFVHDGRVFCAYEMERRWWQFWRAKTWVKIMEVQP